jgi:tetratricopeptide (TPR) repeat protein
MRNRILVLLAAFSFVPATLQAQGGANSLPDPFQNIDTRRVGLGMSAQKVVAGRVFTTKGEPLAHAMVSITNNAGARPQLLTTDEKGEFYYQYLFNWETDEVKHFTVVLKVSRKGFQPAHKIVEVSASPVGKGIPVTLRPVQSEDPTLLSQADLIGGVAPRLKQLGPADGLAANDQKDYARGVQEFLERDHLDQAVTYLSKVAKLNPSCLKCRTMLALAELHWGDWDDAENELTECVNMMLENPKLGVAEPYLAEGVLVSWDQGPAKASAYFTEALKYAPQDVLALQEHGRMQCLNLNWDAGNESLKEALAAGAGPEARLLHAQALLWVATPKEAEAEFNLYLNGRNPKSMPPHVRELWKRIQEAKKDQTVMAAARAKAQARGHQPLDYLHYPPDKLADFKPAADQAQLASILAAVGNNVAAFFADFPNICSMEKVHLEKLDRKGAPTTAQEYKYRYLMLTPNDAGVPGINEYRSDMKGIETPQLGFSDNYMLTSGFASASLVFHPAYQSGSTFRLLGTQKIKNRDTFVVAYAQVPAKSLLSGSFQYGKEIRQTYTQGIAWIDPQTYQILHLISDLLTPMPQIRLDKETTDIEFSEVHFKRLPQSFWLPQAVSVSLDWNGRYMRNQHAYSDFLLFNVDSSQKIGEPKHAEKSVEQPPTP